MLRTEMVWAHEQFWGDEQSKADAFNVSYGNMASMNTFLTDAEAGRRHAAAIARRGQRALRRRSARRGC